MIRSILFLCLLTAGLTAQELPDPTRFEEAIENFEAADAEDPVAPGVILFVGSSSVVMWKTLAEDLEGHRVLNRGFGGSNFNDLLHYADRVIYPYQPKAVFVYEGDNDIAAGSSPKNVLQAARKLRKMIAKNLGGEVPVVFISPKPSVARWDLKEAYEAANDRLASFAESKDHTYFVDVWTPALLPDGTVRKDIFVGDNLHMNAAGYDIWEAAIGPIVDQLDRQGR
ncbi:lysophospholipase L1-like esterase [Neolewinella xylanilytica]|uniref:Lysophospholipase L1-like esterase n=1 Tax=Neolewinella xylanilytica TaxID=1514080 RepID=A0A2S6I0Y2_9BACT|nr:GDSL-type esterase/lipase family protein [Neolewinella xylanilytica]PPK84595.1 lysophospholipase L1-like esterase [Neolewinella xylanilytica]